ncbi:HTH-type transcriptional regulator Lrs14 [Acidianus sp. RZ1]|uniref:HTH-type transcriptional regulator Lrs14 n=1 Tax=Acidianus sp. RZ1 TaxID=1540082 RepID=UPI001492A719|nr:HTH-type transcriptional regulator Lrs14 [Acidianus sp. RZ1]NON61175.1 MarR family transcriptional regulator [Acidianus sp. RZ1]
MEVQKLKVRLPSGKEVGLVEALGFCYDVSDTDFQVLLTLTSGGPKTEDELSASLKLSKASVNRSVNKLISIGFIERAKDQNSKGGRPRYIYKSIDPELMVSKIGKDFEYCAKLFGDLAHVEIKSP